MNDHLNHAFNCCNISYKNILSIMVFLVDYREAFEWICI
jgi:hypothetical protein